MLRINFGHALLPLATVLALACSEGPVDPAGGAPAAFDQPTLTARAGSAAHTGHTASGAKLDAAGHRWIARLRQLTVKYRDFDVATGPGGDYPVEVTPCSELPGTGGQGYHFGNGDLILDGVVTELAPELLMYEPTKNGRMRLIGVEYIVPFALWPAENPAPVLHGQEFMQNWTFEVWALHVWIWEQNPDGMFASWNPRVSCRYAPPAN